MHIFFSDIILASLNDKDNKLFNLPDEFKNYDEFLNFFEQIFLPDEQFKEKIKKCEMNSDILFDNEEVYKLITNGIFILDPNGNILKSIFHCFLKENMFSNLKKILFEKIEKYNKHRDDAKKNILNIFEAFLNQENLYFLDFDEINEKYNMDDMIFDTGYQEFWIFYRSMQNFHFECIEKFKFKVNFASDSYLEICNTKNSDFLPTYTLDKFKTFVKYDFISYGSHKKLFLDWNYLIYDYDIKNVKIVSTSLTLEIKNAFKNENCEKKAVVYFFLNLIHNFLLSSSKKKPLYYCFDFYLSTGIQAIFQIKDSFFFDEIILSDSKFIMKCKYNKQSNKIICVTESIQSSYANSTEEKTFSFDTYELQADINIEEETNMKSCGDFCEDLEKSKKYLDFLWEFIPNEENLNQMFLNQCYSSKICEKRAFDLNIYDSNPQHSATDCTKFIQIFEPSKFEISGGILNFDCIHKNEINGFISGYFIHLYIYNENDKLKTKIPDSSFNYEHQIHQSCGDIRLSSKLLNIRINDNIFLKNKNNNTDNNYFSEIRIIKSKIFIKNIAIDVRKDYICGNWTEIFMIDSILESSSPIIKFKQDSFEVLSLKNLTFEKSLIFMLIGKSRYVGIESCDFRDIEIFIPYDLSVEKQEIILLNNKGVIRINHFEITPLGVEYKKKECHSFHYKSYKCNINFYKLSGDLYFYLLRYLKFSFCILDDLRIEEFEVLRNFTLNRCTGTLKKIRLNNGLILFNIKLLDKSIFEIQFDEKSKIKKINMKNIIFSEKPSAFFDSHINNDITIKGCFYLENGETKNLVKEK